jgi:hypothetical protein
MDGACNSHGRHEKVKIKLSLWFFWTEHHVMKEYWGSGGIAPRILDLGTRWRWVVRFTPRPLYPQRKRPGYPLDRRLGGPQSRSGCGGEEKNSQPLSGFEPSIIQPIAQRYTTELSRLQGSTKSGEFLDQLSDYWPFKMGSAPLI